MNWPQYIDAALTIAAGLCVAFLPRLFARAPADHWVHKARLPAGLFIVFFGVVTLDSAMTRKPDQLSRIATELETRLGGRTVNQVKWGRVVAGPGKKISLHATMEGRSLESFDWQNWRRHVEPEWRSRLSSNPLFAKLLGSGITVAVRISGSDGRFICEMLLKPGSLADPPNKSLQPTATAVTPPAGQEARQP